MDHYNVLGISRNASKAEIKAAYRKLAMQFHPDKHAHSPNNLKEAATLKFKLISQAYDTLIDDRRRSDYNIRRSTNQNHYYTNYNTTTHHSYTSDYSRKGNYNSGKGGGVPLKMDLFFSFLNTKAFLLNAAFVGFLLAGSVVIGSGGHTLWEMQNSGKSFEDAMESIEKAKKLKDKT